MENVWKKWSLPLGSLLVAIIVLWGLMPYNFGYGFVAKTVFEVLQFYLTLKESDWQHCIFVPLISIGLVYLQRDELAKKTIQPSLWGLPILFLGLFVYYFGYRADLQPAGPFSFQVFVIGAVIWFFGWEVARTIAFPLLFLFFTVPLNFMEEVLAAPLRLYMTDFSYYFLNFVGIDVIRDGTALYSAPDIFNGYKRGEKFSLEVANPCSGLRSLFALMMVSALFAHLFLKKTWHKWVLFLCALPLAIFGNFCRILMLTFGTILLGSATAIGTQEEPSTYHLAAGYLVFVVAIGGMFGVSWILEKISSLLQKKKAL